MEGRHEDVETSPSPFFYAISPPREVDGLSQIWQLTGICYGAKVDGHSHEFPGIGVNLAFLHVAFNRVFE